MVIRCPRCNLALKVHTTVSAWDHVVKWHPEWMRAMIRLPEKDSEQAIKEQLREAFPGIVG